VTAVDAEPSMVEAAARSVLGLDVRLAVLPDDRHAPHPMAA
jgi:hypothetical protein